MTQLTQHLSVAVALATVSSAANAGSITRHFNITASDFTSYVGTPAPVDPVTADFTITFDPTHDQGPTSIGIGVANFNLTQLPIVFAYNSSSNYLVISDDSYVTTTSFGTETPLSFGTFILDASTKKPIGDYLTYENATDFDGSDYFSNHEEVSAAPEPSSWALMLVGVGVLGNAVRRSHRGTAIVKLTMAL